MENKEIDSATNGTFDLRVKLNSISNGERAIESKLIMCNIGVQTDDTNVINEPEKCVPPKKTDLDTIEELPADVKEALECPVCYEIMAAPVWLCTTGHSVCPKCRISLLSCPICRKKFLSDTRNFVLEKISYSLGIGPIELSANLCPLWMLVECSWMGSPSEVINHISEMHTDFVLNNGTNRWILKLLTKDVKVFFVHNNVFLYRQRLNTIDKKFFIAVKQLDVNMLNMRYVYSVTLSANNLHYKKVFDKIVLDKNSDISNIEYNSDSIAIDYDTVDTFIKGKGMKYELSIDVIP